MSTPDTPLSIATTKFPKGSEWRRWDLHVHTPESQLGSSFTGVDWDDYVSALEKEAHIENISVIGVTDYMSIDGYEKLLEEKESKGRLSDIDLLIPNIEFRMMPPTKDGKALNLHLLIDPTAPDHIHRIKRALKNLKYEYGDETYGCERKELIEFAYAQDDSIANDDAAYKYGISQFKPDRTKIKEWLNKEGWLLENSLIGIANGKDGISGLPVDGFGATRDEILRWCHFVFSGNPSDRKHYLGLKPGFPPENIIKQYKTLKPCIHGSDAHNISALFKPDEYRYCWLKCDPTFQGLRQILWEPEHRIHIGKIPPQTSDHSQLISKISLSNTKGWFDGNTVDLNPGLIAVIGEKGAGKTAIADMTAIAAGIPFDSKSQSSFITKGQLHLYGLKTKLEWGSGNNTNATLPDRPYKVARPLVRYLSQDFVEKLCSSDHEGTELQRAIEDVIYSRLDEIQKEGYSSFNELRRARESASSSQREGFRGELATLHKEIERLQNAISQKTIKLQTKKETEKQANELRKQIPDATQSIDKNILASLETNQATQKDIEKSISSNIRKKRIIEESAQSYSILKEKVSIEIFDIQESLRGIDVDTTVIENLPPNWNSEIDNLLGKEIAEIDSEIKKLKGTEDDPEGDNSLFAIKKVIAKLKEKISKDEVSRKRLLDLQKQIAEKTLIAERLDKEIINLDTRVSKQLDHKLKQQLDLYIKFFKALNKDEEGLLDLYTPMQEAIEKLGSNMQFEISVGYQIDHKSWLQKSYSFYDGRRTGSDGKRKEIDLLVETKLAPAWKKGDIKEIEVAFSEFHDLVDPKTFITEYGIAKLTLVELYDWMFSVDHIQLSYKVKYSGTELEYLSPGTRGIALLVLYLLMDEDDTRPLIIDQPEGNLDNSSVYKQLVPYIIEAKKRRQIILITHNPNLVVATDAEQVIIATAERPITQPYPRIKYFSGSLEHTSENGSLGVREAVCLLLEGGKDAFRERENRYALSK